MTKLTKKEMFGMLLGLLETAEVAEKETLEAFVTKEIELIEKKAEKSKTYTRKKAEDVLKGAVYTHLDKSEFRVTSDIVEDLADKYEDVTAAKVTARLTALVKEGLVVKEDIKVEKRTLKGYRLA